MQQPEIGQVHLRLDLPHRVRTEVWIGPRGLERPDTHLIKKKIRIRRGDICAPRAKQWIIHNNLFTVSFDFDKIPLFFSGKFFLFTGYVKKLVFRFFETYRRHMKKIMKCLYSL